MNRILCSLIVISMFAATNTADAGIFKGCKLFNRGGSDCCAPAPCCKPACPPVRVCKPACPAPAPCCAPAPAPAPCCAPAPAPAPCCAPAPAPAPCCAPAPAPAPCCAPAPAPAPCCAPAPVTCCKPACPKPCCAPQPCCKPAKKRCGLFSRLRNRDRLLRLTFVQFCFGPCLIVRSRPISRVFVTLSAE